MLKGGVKEMVVSVNIQNDTFSTLLAGLYVTFHNAEAYAIPSYVWLMLADSLAEYLPDWKYDVLSLEEWISSYLLITAKQICTPEEIKQFKENAIYMEVLNGHISLIVTGDILWENSTIT